LSTSATIFCIKDFVKTADILDGKAYNIENQFNDLPSGKTLIVNRKTNRLSLSNILLQFRLARIIRKIDPDIIHFNIDFNHNYFLLRFLLKTPMVWTVHDPLPHSDNDTLREALKRRIFYRLIKNYIILNCEQRQEFIKRYKLQRKHIFNSTLGIYDYLLHFSPFTSLKKTHSPGDSIQLIQFGRINKYKGLKYLLPAFDSIVTKFPNAKLVIAGKGDPEVSKIEEKKNVSFINHYIENEVLAKLISESDFVVCPYTDATQSGVIMTAFAFCKPVIATNVGGLKNFVEDGITGFLIEPGNSPKLEEAIEKFILDPGILEIMSRNIFRIYHTGESSWKAIAGKNLQIYRSIIK
jgi:glycosyltransferase involved in cell wall biosynthesis